MPDHKPSPSRKRRIDVMISSTSKDLPDHRKQIEDAALRCKLNPLAMENSSATDEDAITFSLRLVDEAEIYVGIFAHRYGYIPDDPRNPDRVSITEMEYRRARERGIPILIFVMGDDHAIKAGDVDKESEKVEKLGKLRNELLEKHVVAFFNSPEELRTLALQALVEQRDKLLDTDAGIEEAVFAPEPKAVMPRPPELYALPPYTLTTSGFVGRRSELRELNEWAKSEDTMLVIEAIGGQGKSALTWEWVNDRATDFEGVFWYSFYEQGADMSGFMLHALAYLSGSDPETLKSASRYDLQTALLTRLQSGRYLLVLDGFERVLVAYHRWDDAEMNDDRIVIHNRHRACTHTLDANLLQALVGCRRSRFLITSRLMPRELGESDLPVMGVRTKSLGGLKALDARRYLENLGVKLYDIDILNRFIEQLDGHSLLLKMIAGKITRFHRARGDFDAWYAQEGRDLHLAELDISERRNHILKYALDGLSEEVRLLLSQIAAIGDMISYDTLSAFNPHIHHPPTPVILPQETWFHSLEEAFQRSETAIERQELQTEIDKLNKLEDKYALYQEEKRIYMNYCKSKEYRQGLALFDSMLTQLEEHALIQWNRDNNSYGMHPITRSYALNLLEDYQLKSTYDVLHNHTLQIPEENFNKALKSSDLKNTIFIYQTLVKTGRLDEAANFYRQRLSISLKYKIYNHNIVIDLLTSLIPIRIENFSVHTNRVSYPYETNDLASAFYHVGNWLESYELQKLLIISNLKKFDILELIGILTNVSLTMQKFNKLALAWQMLKLTIDILNTSKSKNILTMLHFYRINVIMNFRTFLSMEVINRISKFIPNTYNSNLKQLYMKDREIKNLFINFLNNKSFNRDNNNLGYIVSDIVALNLQGEIFLQSNQMEKAMFNFQKAVAMAEKQSSYLLFEYLGDIAKTQAAMGQYEMARYTLLEALEGSYTNAQPSLHVSAAEVYLTLYDHEQAKKYALLAYKEAWADGPPYVWWWYLERAKAVLDQLDVPYPALPPFDPSKIEPVPYEREIRAFIDELRQKRRRNR